MKTKFVFLLLSGLLSLCAAGQEKNVFLFNKQEKSDLTIDAGWNRSVLKLHIDTVKFTYKKEYSAYLGEVADKKSKYFDDRLICRDKEIYNYVRAVYHKLAASNTAIPGDLQIYVSHSFDYNASYHGFKNIVINMGLLKALDTEDQLAVILAHEIAHHQLNHFYHNIREYIAMSNDKALQKEIRSAASSSNRPVQKLNELRRQIQVTNTRHSRLNESSADSLAYVYAVSAGYDPKQFISAYEILRVDQEVINEEIGINDLLLKYLGSSIEPFLKGRTNKLHSIASNDAVSLPDSLRTHPDLENRISFFTGKASGNTREYKKLLIPDSLKILCESHHLEWLLNNGEGNLSLALYKTLYHLEKNRLDSQELIEILVVCMKKLGALSKEKSVSKHFLKPNPFYKSDFNQFLKVFDAMYSEDLQKLAQDVYMKYLDKVKDGKNFKLIANI